MKLLSALLLLSLAACGFTPMYGSSAGGSGYSAVAGLDQVEIALIPDQSGVFLRNILIDRFYQNGFPADPAYLLKIPEIVETERDLDITIESETTRKQIRLVIDMTLYDRATSKPVLTRNLVAVTSYNVLGSQFTTRVSEGDAREAALSDLARQVENQLALYFKK